MKRLFKFIISCFCLLAVGGCTYICMYEIYNSFFAEEPKNIITYHNATATSQNSDSSHTIDKNNQDSEPSDGKPSIDNIPGNTEVDESELLDKSEHETIYTSSADYMVLVTNANYSTSHGTVIAMTDERLYIASCYSRLNGAGRYKVTFADGTNAAAEEFRHDSARNIIILSVDKKLIKGNTAETLTDISSGNLLHIREPEHIFTGKFSAFSYTGKSTETNCPLATDSDAVAGENGTDNKNTSYETELSKGTTLLAVSARNTDSVNLAYGRTTSGLNIVSYGKTDVAFYSVLFPNNTELCGSIVITTDGTVVGIYTTDNSITLIEDVYTLYSK